MTELFPLERMRFGWPQWMSPKVRTVIFNGWKVARVVVVTGGVYQIGVLHGVIQHATNPEEVEWKMVQETITSVGGTRLLDRHEKEYRVAHSVANEVLDAARLHCRLKLLELIKLSDILRVAEKKHGITPPGYQNQTQNVGGVNVPTHMIKTKNEDGGSFMSLFKGAKDGMNKTDGVTAKFTVGGDENKPGFYIPAKLDSPINESALHKCTNGMQLPSHLVPSEIADIRNTLNQEGQFFSEAAKLLRGRWDVLVYESAHPNAFVTPTVPRVIFVSTSMFSEYKLTHDELGLILGHEVSHLLLQHTKGNTDFQLYLDLAYIIALTLLPAELMVFGEGMQYMVKSLVASNSREHETEADQMGIQIISRGCFDITKGCNALKKIADRENEGKERTLSYTDTHPLSTDRYRDLKNSALRLQNLAASHNPSADARSRCSGTRALLTSLWR